MSTKPHTTIDYPFAPIPEALLYDARINPLAVRVYGVLARHGMDPGSCYPSHARIAEFIGVAQRSIQRPLRDLESAGWIKRVRRSDEAGGRLTDGFHLFSSIAQDSAPTTQDSVDPPAQTHRAAPRGEREQGNESQTERDRRSAPTRADALTLPSDTTALAKPTREPNELWDAVVAACNISPNEVTNGARGAIAKAVADLRQVGATPAEVHHRAGVYRRVFAQAALTPNALAKHWAQCARLPPTLKPSKGDGAIERFRARKGLA